MRRESAPFLKKTAADGEKKFKIEKLRSDSSV
jgi:hypothetical protein